MTTAHKEIVGNAFARLFLGLMLLCVIAMLVVGPLNSERPDLVADGVIKTIGGTFGVSFFLFVYFEYYHGRN